jgi:hypothetical protein
MWVLNGLYFASAFPQRAKALAALLFAALSPRMIVKGSWVQHLESDLRTRARLAGSESFGEPAAEPDDSSSVPLTPLLALRRRSAAVTVLSRRDKRSLPGGVNAAT